MSKRIWAAQRRPQSNSSRKYVLLFVALLRVWNMDGPTGPTSTSYKIIDPEDFTVAEPFSTNFHCVRPPVAQGPIDIISDGQGCTNWTAPIDTVVTKILRAPTLLQSRRGPGFLHRPTECCLSAGTKTYVTLLPASHSVSRWNFKSHIEESTNIIIVIYMILV